MPIPSIYNKSTEVVFLKSRAGQKGGLEKYTFHLARAFAKKGVAVTLLTTGPAPAIEGIRVVSLASDSSFSYHHFRRFDTLCKQWLERSGASLVFGMERTTSQTHYRAGSGVHAVYLERRKLVDSLLKKLTFPLNPLHRSLLAMEKKAFESPGLKKLFTNSDMVKKEILSLYDTHEEKIETIHNGVEWEGWKEEFEKTFQNRTATETYRLLFVGNGYRRKGLSFLLQGLSKLRHEDFRLTVIGKEKDLPCYVQLAARLGLKEKVTFLGPQNDLLSFYRESDALVIPSLYDPFANVTVEALAMGLFVVSSRYNGGKEILRQETGAVIEDLLSADSVAATLRQAFQTPKTEKSARFIRESVKELDFSHQLDKMVDSTLF